MDSTAAQPGRDDAALVEAARNGDRAAFGALYDRYADRIHDYCLALLRSDHDAADATQDTFLLAAERLDQLREPDLVRPWLYAIARSRCHRRFRTRTRQVPTDIGAEADMGEHLDPEGDAAVARHELQTLVWDAAAGLPERDQTLLTLHLRHDLSTGEIAETLGTSPNHASVLLGRLREQLERSLGALLLARFCRRDCAELAGILRGWDGTLSPLTRKRVARHADACATCEDRRRRLVSPAALLSGVPLVGAPLWLRDQVLASATLPAAPGPGGPGEAGATEVGATEAGATAGTGATDRPGTPGAGGAGNPAGAGSTPRRAAAAAVLLLVLLGLGMGLPGPRSALLALVDGGPVQPDDVVDGAGDLARVDRARDLTTPPPVTGGGGQPDPAPGGPVAVPTGRSAEPVPAPTAPPTTPRHSSPLSPAVSPTPAPPPVVAAQPSPVPPVAPSQPSPVTPPDPSPVTSPEPSPPATAPPPPAPAAAWLAVSPTAVEIPATASAATLALRNDGGQPLTFRVAPDAAWAAATPAQGTLDPGTQQAVTLSVDRRELAEGTTEGTVTVRSDGGDATVTVRVVTERPPTVTGAATADRELGVRGCGTDRTTASATITDESGVAAASLEWTGPDGQGGTTAMLMRAGAWTATLGPFDQSGTARWRIVATDTRGNTTTTSWSAITVNPCPQ
jgi:RNA polymerase sigma factor (sigma-70 family)